MRAAGGRTMAVVAALLLLLTGGLLVAFRPWAGDEPPTAESGSRTSAPGSPTPLESPTPESPAPPGSTTILAAGDIGRCDGRDDEATARIVEEYPAATVLALGDLAYDKGSAQEFQRCYHSSWGPFKERTHPVPGNHEYGSAGAAPYFAYFGSRAGEPGKGWYSFDLGEWHVVALNSNCGDVGCGAGSEQVTWLRADLEANDARCTLAFWHHPRFTSGAKHGSTEKVQAFWEVLVERGVELVLSSHEHLYERTAPLDARGRVDVAHGLRQFVVGTGGGNFYALGAPIEGSEAAIEETAGVLKMTLQPDGYDWSFLPAAAGGDTDSGSAGCH